MKKVSTNWLIHGFALLHALGTISCTLLDVRDSLLLTVLTMTMTVLICYREKLTVEITVASIVLVNILGFLLGNLAALFVFDQFPPIWQHSLSTLIVTELLGWGLYGFANIFQKEGSAEYERAQSWEKHKILLISVIAIILGLRFYLADTYTGNIFKDSTVVSPLLLQRCSHSHIWSPWPSGCRGRQPAREPAAIRRNSGIWPSSTRSIPTSCSTVSTYWIP